MLLEFYVKQYNFVFVDFCQNIRKDFGTSIAEKQTKIKKGNKEATKQIKKAIAKQNLETRQHHSCTRIPWKRHPNIW